MDGILVEGLAAAGKHAPSFFVEVFYCPSVKVLSILRPRL